MVKDIYISLLAPPQNRYEAETAGPSSYITSNLNSFDNLWTAYNYSYDSGTTLIYRDNSENVPALSIPLSLPDGEYKVTAYVAERPEGAITYRYSTDNLTWNNFTVARAGASGIKAVDLGVIDISNGTFYIDDDNNASSGINGWAGWDRVSFQRVPENIGSNIYDVRLYDEIYGKMGIAVKVNSPTNNISLVDDSEIRIYLYQEDTAQTLTEFDYPFDIEIYPHKGWLDSAGEFISLHSQHDVSYIKHTFCEDCVINGPPVAVPTATPSFGEAPLTVQFAANASDPNNDPLTYAWNFGDPLSGDNNSTLENPTHIYDQNGFYHVVLDVCDGLSTINRSITIRVGRFGIDYLLGDIDFDGDVDYADINKFTSAYLSENGDPNYNSDADLDPNNCFIDLYDFALLANDWGKTLP